MNRRMTGRYIPGRSALHRIDARAKFFGFLILIAAVILTDSPIGYVVMITGVVILAYLSGVSVSSIFGSVRSLAAFFIIIFLMNALFFTSDDPIWSFWIINFSKEGAIQGVNVVFRIALIIVMSAVLTTTTPPMGIMASIETFLRPLRLIRLPAEEMAMILSIAIQFIPTLLEESDTIRKAQIARGARFESGKLREKAMAMLPMIVPIFVSSFRRADELAQAMEARGYRGAKNRTPRREKPMDAVSWTALMICAGICALQVVI